MYTHRPSDLYDAFDSVQWPHLMLHVPYTYVYFALVRTIVNVIFLYYLQACAILAVAAYAFV